MPAPLIGLSLSYGLGILLGATFDFDLASIYSILIITFLVACLFIKKTFSRIPIYFCLFLIGMIVIHSNLRHPSHIQNLVSEDGRRKLDLRGQVCNEPEENTLIMEVSEVLDPLEIEFLTGLEKGKWKQARGLSLVRLNVGKIRCRYGDSIEIKNAYLSLPPSIRNPGQFDYRSFLLRNKIYVLANVYSRENITVLGVGCLNPLIRAALIAKRRMELTLRNSMPEPQSLFLEAILLGNRWKLPPEWKEIFSHTGTAHILSISGLHVGFVFSICLIIFTILNFPVKMRAFLTIAIIVIYCVITGSRPPAVRASIMAVMILMGTILERPVNIWNSLASSAFLILLLNPMELFDPGFQMSFMAVSGIIYVHPRLQKLWHPSNSWLRWWWKAVTVITGAQLAILPLVAFYFNVFPPISFAANLVVVPILGLIVGLGFSACISGLIWIGFAHLFNAANWVVITVLLKIVNFLYVLPGSSIQVQSPPVYLIISYYLCVFIVLKMVEDVEMNKSLR